MKSKIFAAAFIFTVAALIVYSQTAKPAFAPAEDFPRDAVIYAQISDLPALITLWNESKFKEDYLETENFKDFKNHHLGRKLASRWKEFNEAAGFTIDLKVLSSMAGNQASLAIYDIGKLEFVFIAPVSEEIFAATKFAQSRENFSEETLADGTAIYRVNVAADRGRQKQELIFTQTKGRFILATDEKLISQTLNNINGGKAKNRLIDQPDFKVLSEKIEPHTAAVWLNQTVLNDDYYFKRYWLISDVKDLKNMRAGIFDFEMQEGKFIERRKFLLDKQTNFAPIKTSEAASMLSFLPAKIPLYRLQKAPSETINRTIEKVAFSHRPNVLSEPKYRSTSYWTYDDYEYYWDDNYESLGEKYDRTIDETENEESIEQLETETDFAEILQPANPQAILTFTQPQLQPTPLFAEFRQAAIINFASSKSFKKEVFESAIVENLAAQTMINATDTPIKWETKTENDLVWRTLNLPMLNRNVSYVLRGDLLILTDSEQLLREILTVQNQPSSEEKIAPFNALTVVNFEEKKTAYDDVIAELNRRKLADDFFTGNIQSLLNSISEIKKIEIKESYSSNIFDEEITFQYK